MLENKNFQAIDQANEYARSMMEKYPAAFPTENILEMEALALEIELQMNRL
jgi:phospholipid N-methyltransferase